MNLQTHMAGQYSGQVPNQAGSSLPAIQHQQNMMQNSGGQRSTLNMDPGLLKARRFIQEKIYEYLMRRQQSQDLPPKKVLDIVKRLEEGLYKTATSKEEYVNLGTLEIRLHDIIKCVSLINHAQQYQQQQGNTSVTHMAGQYSGQVVPNQAGSSLPAIQYQQNMMQNSGGQRSTLNMNPGILKARRFIQEKIYECLMRRQQSQDLPPKKVLDIVKRLEEGLYKTATSKEEYVNLETLEIRLHDIIKRVSLNNHAQQYQQQQGNTSVATGTMITPGISQSTNSSLNVQSSMDQSFVAANGGNTMVNTGSFIPNTMGPSGGMHSAPFTSSDGVTNGYQQSASNFAVRSGGNSLISSMGAQRMAGQMIPTPGFSDNNNNNNSNDNNNNNGNSSTNQSYMNMDSSNNVGISGMESKMVSEPLQQMQQLLEDFNQLIFG